MAWPTDTIITTSMDDGADDASQARAEIKKMADNVNAIKDSRGAANGIPLLGEDSTIPIDELPTIPANKGGTGQTAYTIGDILYASATGTLTKLAAATAGYVLTSNGVGQAPSWQQAGGGLVAGTRMPFNQTSAPTGWTKDTTSALNDSIMRIVTGTVGAGGSTAFSTFNGQNATAGYTLQLADTPRTSLSGSGSQSLAISTAPPASVGAHSHGITTSIKYNDFIIATKN